MLPAIAIVMGLAPSGSSSLGRRAVFSGAAVAAIGTLAPPPAFARSKEAARLKAIEKATAGEARQAYKEYKLAPRPELEGSADTGYAFKEGTVSKGTNGDVTDYFKVKGEKIQADYRAEKARGAGRTLEPTGPAESSAAKPKKRELTEDEKKVEAKRKEFAGMRDDMGRLIY